MAGEFPALAGFYLRDQETRSPVSGYGGFFPLGPSLLGITRPEVKVAVLVFLANCLKDVWK